MIQTSCLKANRPTSLIDGDRKVKFHTVTVYSFPIGIGHNPSVSCGCPIQLEGFEAIDVATEDFDVYQYERSGETRSKSALRLEPQVRTRILSKNGYSLNAIVSATAAAMEMRALRDESIQKTSWEDLKSFFGSKQRAFSTRMLNIATSRNLARTAKTA